MKTWEDPSPDKNRNQHWQNFRQWQNALRKTDNNVVKICQNQPQQYHLDGRKAWKRRKTQFCQTGKYLSSYFPSLMVCIVGHYVIRHKARGECQERWELFPFPVSRDTLYQVKIKEYYTFFLLFLSAVRILVNLMLIDYIVLKQETP